MIAYVNNIVIVFILIIMSIIIEVGAWIWFSMKLEETRSKIDKASNELEKIKKEIQEIKMKERENEIRKEIIGEIERNNNEKKETKNPYMSKTNYQKIKNSQ